MAILERIAEANVLLLNIRQDELPRQDTIFFLEEHPGTPVALLFMALVLRDSAAIDDAHARYQNVSDCLEQMADTASIADFILTEPETERAITIDAHAIEAARLLTTARSLANIAHHLVGQELTTTY